MLNITSQRKAIDACDNRVIEVKADQSSLINTDDYWLQYAKVNLALATTLMGTMFLRLTAASSSSFVSSGSVATDTAGTTFDNSQQLMPVVDTEPLVFTNSQRPIQPRHAKRSGFGGEFQINTYTTAAQKFPSIAGLSTGDFVVVWTSDGQDGDIYGIYGQRFSNIGIAQGSEFQINTYTTSNQGDPFVAALSSGEFVVVWSGKGNGDSFGIYGQRYSNTGAPQGSEFQINTYTTNSQRSPSVTGLSTGDFMVVWMSYEQVSKGKQQFYNDIYGQRYSSTGVPQGSEFQVNTYITELQEYPSIAALNTGDFVVVWQSKPLSSGGGEKKRSVFYGQNGDIYGIYGQRFSNIGIAQGSEFQINTYTTSNQGDPFVAALSSGEFVVVWSGKGNGDSFGIYGQRYSNTGAPQGSEFQVNTYTTNSQRRPSVTGLSTGDFVVVWTSDGQDGNLDGVYGQRYSSTGIPQGSEFQINTYTRLDQRYPSTAAINTGDFVVVWQSGCWSSCVGQDGDLEGIYGRIYFNNNAPPWLMNNALIINESETVVLNTTNLMIMDSDHNSTDLIFTINNAVHGQFERIANAGVPITSFTQQEIIDGTIQFVHDGSEFPPSYEVSVSDGILTEGPFNAAITFSNNVNDMPRIATNALPVKQGETVLLASNMLLATDEEQKDDTQIRFFVTNMQHGQFERINNIGAAISDFTQEEVLIGKIQFVHDNSETVPSFNIAVTDGALTSVSVAGNVIYNNINNVPYFTNIVSLLVQEGQTVTLTSANIQASDTDYDDLSLVFTVSSITHGQFESLNNPGVAIASFAQSDVKNGEISFVHDGSPTAPSFFVSVSDGVFSNSNGPKAADISFTPLNDTPIIILNTLTINEGSIVILTSANLQATDEEIADGSLTFNLANIEHGQFENINNPSIAITSFSQQSIINGDIQFVHNGDEQAPNYAVSVTDGLTSSAPQAATINFTPVNDAPTLLKNELTIKQDATKLLSRLNIEVTDDDNPADEITIAVTNLKNGYFSTTTNPTMPITQFTQQDINDGKIQFTQQGNEKPTYTLTVTDKNGATSTQHPDSTESVAKINFLPKAASANPAPIVLAIAGGAALLTGGIAAGIVYFKKAQDRKTRQQHEFARKIRHYLGLQKIDNFASEQGKRFVQAVAGLSDLLQEEQGIDITTMDENRLDELAGNIATAARNKINPATIGLWKKSAITIQEFADNIHEIAKDHRLLGQSYDDVNIPMHTIDNAADNNFGTLIEEGADKVRQIFSPKTEFV